MSSVTTTHAPKGLEGVVATNSKICFIDGERGVLAYRGIDIHELADHSNFEETCYLLWFGKLPTRQELRELHERLAEERKIDASIITCCAMRRDTLCPWMCCAPPSQRCRSTIPRRRTTIAKRTSQSHPSDFADRDDRGRLRPYPQGQAGGRARPFAFSRGEFSLMLNGKHPSPTAERALDIALILHADHELNASTFAARVTAATLSDMHSAITSAIGALKGPLHGGANEAVFQILEAIDESGADPVDYVKGMLAQKKKIPGFGHRVYHTEDPRATHLRGMSRELGNSSGQAKWFEMSRKIEEFVKAEKKLNANVDFYSASTYHTLGIDIDLFTPIFAISRIGGWAAHVIEQLDDNRLIRPRAEYLGPEYPNRYVPIDKR